MDRRGHAKGWVVGGYGLTLKRNVDFMDLIVKSIEGAGYRPSKDVVIALNPASSGFYEDGLYNLRTEGRKVNTAEMVAMYADGVKKYPFVVLEDGLAEDDWEGWKFLNRELGGKLELVGDDLFVTNVERIQRGIDEDVANAVLVKLNHIGTLTKTIAAVQLACGANWGAMASHRSGETVDSFIADLTVRWPILGRHQVPGVRWRTDSMFCQEQHGKKLSVCARMENGCKRRCLTASRPARED